MPQPAPVSDLSAQIRQVYADADAALAEEQRTIAANLPRLIGRLKLSLMRRRVEALMDHVDSETRTWVTNEFPRVYALGAVTGARVVGGSFTWTQPHLDAITELAQSTFDDLLKATSGVRRSTKLLIRRLAKEQTSVVVAGSRTAVQGGSVMADLLEQKAIWSVRYSDGSVHGIGEYGQMVIRTRSATAYNLGTIKGSGVEWFECFDGPSCGLTSHNDPELANGLILSAEQALANPQSHPNCQRSWGPRPDLLTADDAASAKPSTTPEQLADAAAAEQARLAKQESRRARRAHDQVLARRQERLAAKA